MKEELCDRAGVGTEGNPSSELSASGESYILLRSLRESLREERAIDVIGDKRDAPFGLQYIALAVSELGAKFNLGCRAVLKA